MEKFSTKQQNVTKNLFLYVAFVFIGNVVYKSLVINDLPNPDAIWNGLVYKDNWRWECSLGRYMIRIFQNLFDNIINPTTMTMLSICCIAAVCVIVINIFSLEKAYGVLGGCLILLTPAVAGTLSYYYCSLYYMIAYVFAALAAFIMCKKKTIIWGAGAAILLCLSLATYQAYVCCTVVIVFLYIIMQLFEAECDYRECGYRIVYMGSIFIVGVVLYVLSNKFMQFIWQVSAEEGRGFSSIGHISMGKLPELLKNTYVYIYQYLFTADMINNLDGTFSKRDMNVIFILVLLIILISKFLSDRGSRLMKAIGMAGILLLPIAIMCITIAASDVSIYDSTGMIMLPTVNYIYFLPLLLSRKEDDNKSRYIRWGVYTISGMIILSLFNFSSAMQMYQKTRVLKMDYVANNIAEELEKYLYEDKSYEVCIVGNMDAGNYPELYSELAEKVKWTTASYGTIWNDYSGRQACWREYIKGYLGVNYNSCDFETFNQIIQDGKYEDAPCFPVNGSVYIYNDSVIVIKLS